MITFDLYLMKRQCVIGVGVAHNRWTVPLNMVARLDVPSGEDIFEVGGDPILALKGDHLWVTLYFFFGFVITIEINPPKNWRRLVGYNRKSIRGRSY